MEKWSPQYPSICSPVSFNLLTVITWFVYQYPSICSLLAWIMHICFTSILEFIHQYHKFLHWYPWIHVLVSVYLFGGIPLSLHWYLSIHSLILSQINKYTIAVILVNKLTTDELNGILSILLNVWKWLFDLI